MSQSDSEIIEELARLEAAATPGRVWEYDADVQKLVSLKDDGSGGYIGDGELVANSVLATDAALIAAMRNALPRLLQLARESLRADDEIAALEDRHTDAHADACRYLAALRAEAERIQELRECFEYEHPVNECIEYIERLQASAAWWKGNHDAQERRADELDRKLDELLDAILKPGPRREDPDDDREAVTAALVGVRQMQAEIQSLSEASQYAATQHAQQIDDLQRENLDLRRLVGRLQLGNTIESDFITKREEALMAECDRLRKHNALQQSTLHELHGRAKVKDKSIRELRAALVEIANGGASKWTGTHIEWAKHIARRALEESK